MLKYYADKIIQSPDDWMIWADGTMAQREDIDNGDYSHRSDDYRLATEQEVAELDGDM